MPAPYTPRNFEALIIQEDDSLCDAIKKLQQISTMWWILQRYKYSPGGAGFTDEYAALIEAALEACPDDAVTFDGVVPNPQDFKNFLLSPTSIFCEKFVKLATGLSQKIYEWVAFEWNADGTDFSDEFKALLCGIDCGEPEIVDPNYILNYTRFIKWDVVSGAVDLIGLEPYHPVASGTGLYVDMHGTQNDEHPQVQLSVMRTKNPAYAFEVEAGKSYRITYKLAGNNIASFVVPGTTRVRLLKASDNSLYEAVDATHTASAWDMAFATQTVNFTAGSTETVVLQIESAATTYIEGVNGTMNVGPKIDDVLVQNLTDATTLFSDDFEEEMDNSGVVTCPTPDPNDSKAAVALASMGVCEKLSKIVLAFPQNVYDVAAWEFNAAGSGFSACLKAWICNPTSVLVDENGLLTGLIAYWAHDEASGDLIDSHTGGHDLSEEGGTLTAVSGKKVGARDYPGTVVASDVGAAWNTLDGLTGVSFTAWVKFSTLPASGDYMVIMSKGPNAASHTSMILALSNSGGVYGLYAFANPAGSNIVFTPVVDTWYFMAFTVSGSAISISIGDAGTLTHYAGTAYTPPLVDSTNDGSDEFILGGTQNRFTSALEQMLDGVLDEVGLWSRALSEDDLAILYNSGTGRSYSEFTS
jgi:O-acetyl-ADP-ribose deacetylase (regulator of RNase III)